MKGEERVGVMFALSALMDPFVFFLFCWWLDRLRAGDLGAFLLMFTFGEMRLIVPWLEGFRLSLVRSCRLHERCAGEADNGSRNFTGLRVARQI